MGFPGDSVLSQKFGIRIHGVYKSGVRVGINPMGGCIFQWTDARLIFSRQFHIFVFSFFQQGYDVNLVLTASTSMPGQITARLLLHLGKTTIMHSALGLICINNLPFHHENMSV